MSFIQQTSEQAFPVRPALWISGSTRKPAIDGYIGHFSFAADDRVASVEWQRGFNSCAMTADAPDLAHPEG